MKKQIVIASALALLFHPYFTLKAQAQSETASCKDIPSCGVQGIILGTVLIGNVLYYLVDYAGSVHKVRAKQVPVHKIESNQNEHEEIFAGLVETEEACKRKALVQGERVGGTWTHRVEDAGISSPETDYRSGRKLLKCYIRKVNENNNHPE